jgi:hypothetical protein
MSEVSYIQIKWLGRVNTLHFFTYCPLFTLTKSVHPLCTYSTQSDSETPAPVGTMYRWITSTNFLCSGAGNVSEPKVTWFTSLHQILRAWIGVFLQQERWGVRMPPVQSTFYQKTLIGQSREIVTNVMHLTQKEADEHKFVLPVSKVHVLIAYANGISKTSLKFI